MSHKGTGTLQITNGGRVKNRDGFVGSDGTAKGTVIVENATWQNSRVSSSVFSVRHCWISAGAVCHGNGGGDVIGRAEK